MYMDGRVGALQFAVPCTRVGFQQNGHMNGSGMPGNLRLAKTQKLRQGLLLTFSATASRPCFLFTVKPWSPKEFPRIRRCRWASS